MNFASHSMPFFHFSLQPFKLDACLIAADQALRTLWASPKACRVSPHMAVEQTPGLRLRDADRATSGALMRVNHVGEVCAQALYSAQALVSSNETMRDFYVRSRKEETDHLAWTQQRLKELGDRPSLLTPLWFAGSFALGLLAGSQKDHLSLGFVMETERQVEAHLQSHLHRLPPADVASKAIVAQIAQDEAAHGTEAAQLGGTELSTPIKGLMSLAAKIMTSVAHHI